jgi:hypothetical protein
MSVPSVYDKAETAWEILQPTVETAITANETTRNTLTGREL